MLLKGTNAPRMVDVFEKNAATLSFCLTTSPIFTHLMSGFYQSMHLLTIPFTQRWNRLLCHWRTAMLKNNNKSVCTSIYNTINCMLLYLAQSMGHKIGSVIKTLYVNLVNMQTDDLRESEWACDESWVTVSCVKIIITKQFSCANCGSLQ